MSFPRCFTILCAAALLAGPLSAQTFILTNDQQLRDLATDPNKKIDNTTGYTKQQQSLSDAVNQAQRDQSSCITIAFDEFFRQYRDDQNTERNLTPDMDEYVEYIGQISDYTTAHGNVGLELSLLSPLELGQAYQHQTGHTGQWIAFKVGMRNRHTGKFSIQMWQQLRWTNNKGETPVQLGGVRAYAFRTQKVTKTQAAVDPNDIRPLTDVHWEVIDSIGVERDVIPQQRLRIYGEEAGLEGYDHVLVLLEYHTQEMDYFAPDALPFLTGLLDKYKQRNVNLQSLYCDEMHIQQDWNYFGHQEDGQLNVRFFTPSLAEAYTQKTGQPFDERYLLYFVSQPPLWLPKTEAVLNVEYVLGSQPTDVQRTYLLRDRYYRLLQNHVVDLFLEAKQYAENLFGHHFETAAHSSWAESPTIDKWDTPESTYAVNYEYTPNFIWSNTVHQAAAACYDYFKWGEYLEPTGNDFCECGWLDRDYYGAAMAASIAVVNRIPNAYAAAWGMPWASKERRMAINYAYGCEPPADIRLLTGNVIRDEDVLMLYPMNLVAVDPRFGSWMVQYGYANYLTSDKLLQMGHLTPEGKLRVADKEYSTLVALFEPLPPQGLLPLMQQFVAAGGKVVWLSTPPLLDQSGRSCVAAWESLFGVSYSHTAAMGRPAAGRRIQFEGAWSHIPTQEILADFLVDHVYPVTPSGSTEVVARCDNQVLGTVKHYSTSGLACYAGFRPRDDQSQSLGYETRTLFELLNACGAYPATGVFKSVNDHPDVLSRTTDYFVSRFPNGTTFVVNHYRTHVETWSGGFSRNNDQDAEFLRLNPLPSDTMRLRNVCINGHKVSYEGRLSMAFNVQNNVLSAFYGQRCSEITVDGRRYRFAQAPLAKLSFGPVDGDTHHLRIYASGQPRLTLPLPANVRQATVTLGNEVVPSTVRKGTLEIQLEEKHYGRALDVQLK